MFPFFSPNDDDKVWDTFQESPKMSTYVFALVIGELTSIRDESDGRNISIWTEKGKENKGIYALNLTKSVIEKLEEYTDIKYLLPKLDQVAVPTYGFDAMENWGIISYM